MSQENVELVQSVLEAWNRADYASALEHVAPEIKTEGHLGDDLDGTYEGIAGLQKYLADYWSSFTDFHVEIDECIAGGTEVAFLAHLYGRGRASGVEVERRNWQVARFEAASSCAIGCSAPRPKPSKPPGCRNRCSAPCPRSSSFPAAWVNRTLWLRA
jgi:ketosteroid isomerase-like protein